MDGYRSEAYLVLPGIGAGLTEFPADLELKCRAYIQKGIADLEAQGVDTSSVEVVFSGDGPTVTQIRPADPGKRCSVCKMKANSVKVRFGPEKIWARKCACGIKITFTKGGR